MAILSLQARVRNTLKPYWITQGVLVRKNRYGTHARALPLRERVPAIVAVLRDLEAQGIAQRERNTRGGWKWKLRGDV